jgi:hypothetical protein
MAMRLYESGLVLGSGHDSISNEIHDVSVVRTPLESLGGGQVVTFSLERVTSHEELAKKLDVSAEAQMGNAVSGGGSIAAAFHNSIKVDNYSIYLLVNVKVVNSHKKMTGLRLTTDAFDLLNVSGEDEFRRRYGDEFVVGATTGGSFFCLFQMHTHSEEEKTNLEVSLNVNGSAGSWSAAGDFKTAINTARAISQITVFAIQSGGNVVQHDTPDEIVNQALNFPDQVNASGDQSIAYFVEMLSYKSLPLPPGRNPIDIRGQKDVIPHLAKRYSVLLDLLNSVQYVVDHQNEFIFTPELTVEVVTNQIEKLEEALDLVKGAASACYNDYHNCHFSVGGQPPEIKLPERVAHSQGTLDPLLLTEYLNEFKNIPGYRPSSEIDPNVLKEMRAMGITSIGQLDDIIANIQNFKNRFKTVSDRHDRFTFTTIIRDVLIIHDIRKYFLVAYKPEYYNTFYLHAYKLFEEFGVNRHEIPAGLVFDDV